MHHWIIYPHSESIVLCDSFFSLISVVVDANTIQIPALHIQVWAENTNVLAGQWAPETMGIWP